MTGDLFTERRPPDRARRVESGPAEDTDARDHVCAVCGENAGFGFDVFLRKGRAGRWACLAHRDRVEEMGS